MKTLTLIFCLVMICDKSVSQITEYANFKVINNDVIFQAVFDSTVRAEDCLTYLQSLTSVSQAKQIDDYITAEFSNLSIDFRLLGRKWGSTPIVFTGYTVNGNIRVDFKDDRYRVTITGLELVEIRTNYTRPFYESALKRNRQEIRSSWATDNLLGLYDEYFRYYFRVKLTTLSDDW